MEKMPAAQEKSVRIRNLTFFMMLCIVWTHARLPQWDVVPGYFQTLAITNEIGQDAVAPFFLITGFLFFRNFQIGMYVDKLKTRLHSLVIPYLLWNSIGALSWYAVITLSGNRYVSDHFAFDSIGQVLGDILACQYTILWYVGVIIVYAVAAPFFYYLACNKRIGIMSVIVFFIIGISFHHPYSSPLVWMSIYMLGTLLGVHDRNFLFHPQPRWLTLSALIMFPVCVGLNHECDNMLTVNLRQWSSIFFFIGIYDILDRSFHLASHSIYKYTFFLYATHYLLVHIAQRYIIRTFGSTTACWAAYILVPILVVAACIATAYLLDKKAHRMYNLLSGNR